MATSLPQDILLVALSARGIVELGLSQDQAPLDMLSALRSIDGAGDASPLELSMFCAELDAVMLELSQEEPEVVHTGSTAAMEVGDDVGLREDVVDSLASIAKVLAGGENAAPVSDSALGKEDPAGATETQLVERKTKYPRVDPPDIEDQPGQAIREDTPGYIAKAFPKLFPHGTVGMGFLRTCPHPVCSSWAWPF